MVPKVLKSGARIPSVRDQKSPHFDAPQAIIDDPRWRPQSVRWQTGFLIARQDFTTLQRSLLHPLRA